MATTYTYEERKAIDVVRNTMQTKPDIIKDIMKDMAYMQSFNILRQTQRELDQLMKVTEVFANAATAIIQNKPEYFDVDN
jgi:5'(3')-deoxyribonucleotidase